MRWIIKDGEICLSLTAKEAETVADILKTKMAVLASRRERYHDNIANGATEKYARLYDAAEIDFDTCSYFIKLVNEFRAHKSTHHQN